MVELSTHKVTQLLVAWDHGDQLALKQLVPRVHAEQHRLDRRYMGNERAGHPLQLIYWKKTRMEKPDALWGISANDARHSA